MNFSGRLNGLVRLLFEIHKSSNGNEFNLNRSQDGFHLVYPGGSYPKIGFNDFDFLDSGVGV